MIYKRNQSGYILAVTLALMTLFMFIATYVSNKGLIFSSFSRTMVDREKARQLAYGGIQLAISQLSVSQEKKPENANMSAQAGKDQEAKSPQQSDGKVLLKAVLPQLGRLQKFNLKQNVEGITAEIGIMITSEEGKININRLYDFEKHSFIGEPVPGKTQAVKEEANMKLIAQELFARIKERLDGDLFGEFEKFLKEKKYPINDITELLSAKGFEIFKDKIFRDPVLQPEKDQVYLTDIFTISSSKQSIEPWLMSDSLVKLFNFKRDTNQNVAVDELLKNFKEKSDWKNDWDKSLKNLYGVSFQELPKSLMSLLNPVFDPKMFSVFSYATVGGVTVRLIAVLERGKKGKDGQVEVKVRSIYLL